MDAKQQKHKGTTALEEQSHSKQSSSINQNVASSPVNSAHLLTFSQITPQMQQLSGSVPRPYINQVEQELQGNLHSIETEEATTSQIAKTSHQTPFFNKYERMKKHEVQGPSLFSQKFSPSKKAKKHSGQKLMNELVSCSNLAYGSQKLLVQQNAPSEGPDTAQPFTRTTSQQGITEKSQQQIEHMLALKMRRSRNKNSFETQSTIRSPQTGMINLLENSQKTQDEKASEYATGKQFLQSQTIKIVSQNKKSDAPAAKLTPNIKQNQAKSAYLTTTRVVNFERNQDPFVTKGEQKEGKLKLSRIKPQVPHLTQQFNPALVYGKHSAPLSPQAMPQKTPAPKILAAGKNLNHLITDTIAQDLCNEGSSAKFQIQSTKINGNKPKILAPQKGLAFKSKKFASFVSLSSTKSLKLRAASLVKQEQQQPSLAASVSAQKFKRNRVLVDRKGQRVFQEPSQVQTSLISQQLPLNQTQLLNNEENVSKNEINFSVMIQQPTQINSGYPSSSQAKQLGEAGLTRVTQSSQNQKRQISHLKASFKSHANSSQGFHSEEMIQLKQSQGKNGGITTQFKFKINGNHNQHETGVQLELTQGETCYEFDRENKSPSAFPHQPHVNYPLPPHQQTFSNPYSKLILQEAQDNILMSPQAKHQYSTLFQAYQASFEQALTDAQNSLLNSPQAQQRQYLIPETLQQQQVFQAPEQLSHLGNQFDPPLQVSYSRKSLKTAGINTRASFSKLQVQNQHQLPLHIQKNFNSSPTIQPTNNYQTGRNYSSNGRHSEAEIQLEQQLADQNQKDFQRKRIQTAKSPQDQDNLTSKSSSVPRRKYRPVLPKHLNIPISMSVQVSKSGTSETGQAIEQFIVSDTNRLQSPNANRQDNPPVLTLISGSDNLFSFKKLRETDIESRCLIAQDQIITEGDKLSGKLVSDEQNIQSFPPQDQEAKFRSKRHSMTDQNLAITGPYTVFTPVRNGMSFSGKETFYKKQESGSKFLTSGGYVDSDPNLTATFLEEKPSFLNKSPLQMIEQEFTSNNLLITPAAKAEKTNSLDVAPFQILQSNRSSELQSFRAEPKSSINPSDYIQGHLGNSQQMQMEAFSDGRYEDQELLQVKAQRKNSDEESSTYLKEINRLLSAQQVFNLMHLQRSPRERAYLPLNNLEQIVESQESTLRTNSSILPMRIETQSTTQQNREKNQYLVTKNSIYLKQNYNSMNMLETQDNRLMLEVRDQISMERSDKSAPTSGSHVSNQRRLFQGQKFPSSQNVVDGAALKVISNPYPIKESSYREKTQSESLHSQLTKLNINLGQKTYADDADYSPRAQDQDTFSEFSSARVIRTGTGASNFIKVQSQSNQQTRQGLNIHSVDSMSQASSQRRNAPVKVIYNKFFKEKGFFPPLNAQNGQPKTVKPHSRSDSVNSQTSYEHTNRTIETRAKSPESQQLINSIQRSERKISQQTLEKQNTMMSDINTEGSEIGSLSDRRNIFKRQSVAEKVQPHSAEHESALIKSLSHYSIESKREDPAELQNCFTNALNMALQQAPIQQRSYPQLAKHQVQEITFPRKEDNQRQMSSKFAPKSQLLQALPTFQSMQITNSSRATGPFTVKQTTSSKFIGGKGIVYTGKEKPEQVMKQLQMIHQSKIQQKNSVPNNYILTENFQIGSIQQLMVPKTRKDILNKKLTGNYQPRNTRLDDDEIYLDDDDDDDEDNGPGNLKSIDEKITYLQKLTKVKKNSHIDGCSEERKAEGDQQAFLQKIVSSEKQKYRLQSSKITTVDKNSITGVMSPLKGLIKVSNESHQYKLKLSKNCNSQKSDQVDQKWSTHDTQSGDGLHEECKNELSRPSSYINRIINEKKHSVKQNSKKDRQNLHKAAQDQLGRPQQETILTNHSIQANSLAEISSHGEDTSAGKPPTHGKFRKIQSIHKQQHEGIKGESPQNNHMQLGKVSQSVKDLKKVPMKSILINKINRDKADSEAQDQLKDSKSTPFMDTVLQDPGNFEPVDSGQTNLAHKIVVPDTKACYSDKMGQDEQSFSHSQPQKLEGETNMTFGMIQNKLLQRKQSAKHSSMLIQVAQKSFSQLKESKLSGESLKQSLSVDSLVSIPTVEEFKVQVDHQLTSQGRLSSPSFSLGDVERFRMQSFKMMQTQRDSQTSKASNNGILITDQQDASLHKASPLGLEKMKL